MARDGTDHARLRVGVLGAGAIGGHVGVRLSAAGVPVVLVGRRRLIDARARLSATDRNGAIHRPGADLVVTEDVGALAGVDVCLVTVKGGDTSAAARALATAAGSDVPVVSLQNGLRNPDRLHAHLSAVAAGVVGLNVVVDAPGVTRQTVAGGLYLGTRPGSDPVPLSALAAALSAAGIRTRVVADIEAVAAGKLLLNLNNGIGGATGLGIAAMLADADARACFFACVAEGRRVLAAAQRPVARVGWLSPRVLEASLRAPAWLVGPLAAHVGGIDRDAVTSTLADLRRGRPTEIGDLNGEIVEIGRSLGIDCPANAAVVAAVQQHEAALAAGRAPRWLEPAALRRRMHPRAQAA